MKEFIDKLIDRLREESYFARPRGMETETVVEIGTAISIVNELAEEYKVSEIPTGSECKTNADRIRSMSDEELAEFIDSGCPDCARLCPDFKAGCSWTCQHHQGKDFLLKWLQSEVE